MFAALTGLGLSAAAGLNAYVPLLLVGLVDRFSDAFTLPEPYGWIASGPALAVIAVLLAAELVLDKIPLIDHLNDLVQTVVRPTVGGVVFAASTAAGQLDTSAWLRRNQWAGFLAGLLLAGLVHAVKATVRPVVNVSTFGAGAPVVSAAEDAASLGLSLAALFAPLLALVVLLLLGWAAVVALRRVRHLRHRPRPG